MQRRILRNVELHEATGCWLWRGAVNNDGYPRMNIREEGGAHKQVLVHRAAWEAFRRRRIPRGRVCAHDIRCVARRCCNPEHVRATTQSHNERDKARKARLLARGGAPWPKRKGRTKIPPCRTIFPIRRKKRVRIDGVDVPF